MIDSIHPENGGPSPDLKKTRRKTAVAERAGSPAGARKSRFKREAPEKRRSDLIDAAIRKHDAALTKLTAIRAILHGEAG